MKRIIIGAAVLLLVGAAYNAGAGSAGAEGEVAAVPTASPTSTPTVAPTPTPTLRPTPTPAPVIAPEWLAFIDWGSSSLGRCDTDPFLNAMQRFDDVDAYVEAVTLGQCYEEQVAWLDAHPPLSCYADLWTATRGFFSKAAQSLSYAEKFWYEFPDADYRDLERANELLTEAVDLSQTLNSTLEAKKTTALTMCLVPSA